LDVFYLVGPQSDHWC